MNYATAQSAIIARLPLRQGLLGNGTVKRQIVDVRRLRRIRQVPLETLLICAYITYDCRAMFI